MSKVNDLKQENEIKIRECLYDGQIWTKNDLTYKTSLSLATTTNILQEMLKSHEIEYVSDSKSTGGRKSKEYQLYKDYKHLLKIVLKKNKKSYEFIFEIIDLYDQIVYQKYPHYQNSALIYQPAIDYVDCGMIVQGKLYNGFSHFAGELRCLPFYDHLPNVAVKLPALAVEI